jgi:hypothetical protein
LVGARFLHPGYRSQSSCQSPVNNIEALQKFSVRTISVNSSVRKLQ